MGIQGLSAFASLQLALQPLALEKIHSSLQWSGVFLLYSDVELYEVYQGEDQGQPLPEAIDKRQLDEIHARDTRDPNQRQNEQIDQVILEPLLLLESNPQPQRLPLA